jgi:AcrR family transcriptional regulator
MAPNRSDSLRTQAQLMSTAERLFAERGIDAVSLSEINRLAGQRNKSALHYHFGSRENLLRSLLEKHRVRLDDRRAEMLDDLDGREPTLREAVTIMVRPLAEQLDDRVEGGMYYVQIMAQLAAAPHHPLNDWLFNELPPAFMRIAPVLYGNIPRAPTILRMRRAQLMNGTMFHALTLLTYGPDVDDTLQRREMYVNDLIDCICALLSAPVDAASAEVIDRHTAAGITEPAADDSLPQFGEESDLIPRH